MRKLLAALAIIAIAAIPIVAFSGPAGQGSAQSSAVFTTIQTTDPFKVFHKVQPTQPAPQAPTTYPLGNDLELNASGTADIWLKINPYDMTSTPALSIGVNTGIALSTGNTANLCPQSAGCVLLVDPYGANEETVASWSIVDATHITLTCTKTHSAGVIIRQEGSGVIEARRMVIRPLTPAQNGLLRGTEWQDRNLFTFMTMPADITAGNTFPANAVVFSTPITGNDYGDAGVLRFRPYNATGRIVFANSGNTVEFASATDATGWSFGTTAVNMSSIANNGAADLLINGGSFFVRSNKIHVDGSIRNTFGGNSDLAGVITLTGTSGTYTFTETYAAAPFCVCTDISASPSWCAITSTTTTVVTFSGASGHSVNYICIGKGS